jgi:hypothetical protein
LRLSSDALTAAATAFAPFPGEVRVGRLPPDAILVLDGDVGEALGIAEAERRLTGVAADRRS